MCKVMLNKKNLTDLMKGKVLTIKKLHKGKWINIQIALSDIGYDQMHKALQEAISDLFAKQYDATTEIYPGEDC